MKLILSTILLLLLTSAPIWAGETYHVAVTGSNAGVGNEEHPWRDISYAISKIKPGARYEVRSRGSAAINFRGGDRVESRGPASVQVTPRPPLAAEPRLREGPVARLAASTQRRVRALRPETARRTWRRTRRA